MVRRFILTAAATIGLLSLPLAAMAYDAPGFDTTVSDPTPAIGQAFTITTEGGTAGEQLMLTVTCTPAAAPSSMTIAPSGTQAASGSVTWNVTLASAGTCTLAVTDEAGALVGEAVVTGDAVVAGDAARGPGFLAETGWAPIGIIGGSLLLLALGGVAVAARRRRATA